ncbi:MAG: hypothetical protein KDE50_04010 [Caldilineaceae bacterium]|nr:hypothetical protein [Caldilineaceae bacterium]
MAQLLYEQLGFQQVQTPGLGCAAVKQATRHSPNPGEIRMRLRLYSPEIKG